MTHRLDGRGLIVDSQLCKLNIEMVSGNLHSAHTEHRNLRVRDIVWEKLQK